MTVGLVIVSHSEKIAAGIVELASQMAGDITMIAAGGREDGGIGTSFGRVSAAIPAADSGAGVLVLCDLGSAVLTAETALELLADGLRDRVRIADAPIVEGSVAAAVSAQSGGDLEAVAEAAESANAGTGLENPDPTGPQPPIPEATTTQPTATGSATLVNPSGLHARPAAEFVKLASTFDARISVNGVDAKSLLRIMSLGLGMGSTVTIEATGSEAEQAVAALRRLVDGGFGE